MEPFSRRSLLTRSPLAIGAGALASVGLAREAVAQNYLEPAIELNVREFGAIGNGQAENMGKDTAAFIKAINASKVRGAIVRVPMGTYLLDRELVLSDQHLLGHVAGGWNPDNLVSPTLVVMQSDRPAITMAKGSSIHGLTILESMAADAKAGIRHEIERRFQPKPPTIRVQGQASISNIKISTPFDAIEFDDNTENGRSNIENVFIISPGRDGIFLTHCSDLPTLRNIEVWCNFGPSKGAAYRFGHNDEIHAARLFAFGCEVGFAFADSPVNNRGTYGTFLDCATDGCIRGWTVQGKSQLNILGGNFMNHLESLLLRAPASSVRIEGTRLESNGAPVIACDEVDGLILNGCEIGGSGQTDQPHIRIGAGVVDRASITGCHIRAAREPNSRLGIEIRAGVRQCSIVGNIFAAGPADKVTVQRGPGSEVVLAGNLGEPISQPL